MNDSNKVILFIAAHTDDVELSCGATVARFIRLGADVHYLAMTSTDNNTELEREATESMKVLGIAKDNYNFLHKTNRFFPMARQEILHELEIARDRINPNIVFCPSRKDIHQDHYQTSIETLRAFKRTADLVLGYDMCWNMVAEPFDPKFYVEVREEDVNKKLESIFCYKSQLFRDYMDKEKLRSQILNNGMRIGVKFAEAFEVYRQVWKG